MLWDSSLNRDVDDCVHYQVVLTEILPRNKNGYWPKEKFICSTPNLRDRSHLCVVDPSLGPNAGAMMGSSIMRDFDKIYGKKLTIICRSKGWAVDGCGNRHIHLWNSDYFDPNREANNALVSRPCFTYGGVHV